MPTIDAIPTHDLTHSAQDESGYFVLFTFEGDVEPHTIAYPKELLGKLVEAGLKHMPPVATLDATNKLTEAFPLTGMTIFPAENGFFMLELIIGNGAPLRIKLPRHAAAQMANGLRAV